MKYKLGDIVKEVIDYRGKTPKKLGFEWSKSGIRALSAKNIKTGQIVQPESIRYVSKEDYPKWMKQEVERGTILITSEAPFGQIFYWDSDEKIVLSQRLFAIKVKDEFDSKYIYYQMTSNEFQSELKARATGSTVTGLRQPELMKCEIDIPDLEIQRKIVRILSALDQKIELNNNESNTLQSIIDTQYRKVFSGNENNNKVKASDLFNYESGYSYTSAELADASDIGMMTIKNFERTGGFKADGFKALSPKKETIKTAALYDIFISCTDVTQNADIIGNAVMLLDTDKYNTVTYSMDLVRIIPKINRFALYAILNSKDFKSFALGYKSGTTVLHLNKKCLTEYKIALPDERTLDFFGATVERACKKIAINLAENRTLRQIRDALLLKLMSGGINLDGVTI